jgi:hypothetical protein
MMVLSYVLSLEWLHATIPSSHRFCFLLLGPIWSNSGLCFSESGQMDSERRRGDGRVLYACAFDHMYAHERER